MFSVIENIIELKNLKINSGLQINFYFALISAIEPIQAYDELRRTQHKKKHIKSKAQFNYVWFELFSSVFGARYTKHPDIQLFGTFL